MALENAPIATFNRGLVDVRGLARVDLKRVALSAETQTNWMPRSLGSMMLRPGLEHLGSSKDDAKAKYIPFIFATDDFAILEITDGTMRVRINDALIERAHVDSAVTNGAFDTTLNDWENKDEAGTTSVWETGGYMALTGTRFNAAIRRQEVAVSGSVLDMVVPDENMASVLGTDPSDASGNVTPDESDGDVNVEHALRVVVQRGPVTIKVGSTSGGQDYISETDLNTGVHSLAFTPTGNFHIDLSNRAQAKVLVASVTVEAVGKVEVPVPWGVQDLKNLRWGQSADVVFVACNGYQQRRIERRGTGRSWSVVNYEPDDGPFRDANTSTLRLTPGALTGDTTLTASRALFASGHVGALFRVTSIGQKVTVSVTGEGQFSDAIRVVGVGNSRIFVVDVSGTWVATVTLQRSIDDQSSWTDVTTYTVNQSAVNFNDALDNQIVFYRIGVDTGDFTSGTAVCTLTYSGGGIPGIGRVTSVTSSTIANVAVLKAFGQTTATNDWAEGVWSDSRGWPSAAAFYEGRLWWLGKNRFIGSVSDAFESFDDEVEGDSGPINRTIGSGPVDFINWVLPIQRLIVGTDGAEISARSTAFDEPLTPTNFNLKEASTYGSAVIQAVKVDSRGLFVPRSADRLLELNFDFSANDYAPTDLSILVPDIGRPGFTHIAVQRHPDTRIHGIRSDGTAAVLVYLPAEELRCWIEVETGDADGTNGVIEDAFVLPGDEEDRVYYSVKRVINGSTKRYLEKWALESECVGGTLNKQADSFLKFTNTAATATITGLSYLEGKSVVVWADGKCLDDSSGDVATFTVSGGSITLTDGGSSYSATTGIVGLAYKAQFKSAKLPYAVSLGTVLSQKQRISKIGLILVNTHHKGLKFGRDFTNMDNLPQTVDGTTVTTDTVHTFFDQPMVTFPGESTTNARLCLEANAPRCATVAAAVLGLATHDTAP